MLIAKLGACAVFGVFVNHVRRVGDGAAAFIEEPHAAGADMILRRGLAFDDADPFLLRLGDAGEIIGCFLELRLGDVLGHLLTITGARTLVRLPSRNSCICSVM